MSTSPAHMDALPDELLACIVSFQKLGDRARFARCSRRLLAIVDDDAAWKEFYERHEALWGQPYASLRLWKDRVRCAYQRSDYIIVGAGAEPRLVAAESKLFGLDVVALASRDGGDGTVRRVVFANTRELEVALPEIRRGGFKLYATTRRGRTYSTVALGCALQDDGTIVARADDSDAAEDARGLPKRPRPAAELMRASDVFDVACRSRPDLRDARAAAWILIDWENAGYAMHFEGDAVHVVRDGKIHRTMAVRSVACSVFRRSLGVSGACREFDGRWNRGVDVLLLYGRHAVLQFGIAAPRRVRQAFGRIGRVTIRLRTPDAQDFSRALAERLRTRGASPNVESALRDAVRETAWSFRDETTISLTSAACGPDGADFVVELACRPLLCCDYGDYLPFTGADDTLEWAIDIERAYTRGNSTRVPKGPVEWADVRFPAVAPTNPGYGASIARGDHHACTAREVYSGSKPEFEPHRRAAADALGRLERVALGFGALGLRARPDGRTEIRGEQEERGGIVLRAIVDGDGDLHFEKVECDEDCQPFLVANDAL